MAVKILPKVQNEYALSKNTLNLAILVWISYYALKILSWYYFFLILSITF